MDPTADVTAIGQPTGPAAFEESLSLLRPKLHRYCARMIGSAIEAEDVVQETFVKAIEASRRRPDVGNPEAWLFRIAHNTALDHLRQRARRQRLGSDEDPTEISDPTDEVYRRQAAAAGLRAFMRLTVAQRSSIILMDVLGYTLEEIGDITGTSIPAVKAALHRGRLRLHAAAAEPEDTPPLVLSAADQARLSIYVDRFNARDFDAIRDMLADDVRLHLVNKTAVAGRTEVERYFSNYDRVHDWRLQLGFVDRSPAIIVSDPRDSLGRSSYFIVLEWAGERISNIRDFRHALYAIEAAEVILVERGAFRQST